MHIDEERYFDIHGRIIALELMLVKIIFDTAKRNEDPNKLLNDLEAKFLETLRFRVTVDEEASVAAVEKSIEQAKLSIQRLLTDVKRSIAKKG